MAGQLEQDIEASKSLRPGSDHYRSYVGPPAQFDFMGATQFRLLTSLGLTEEHTVLDLGCGSLRAGRFLIHYLLPGRYMGVEPNAWLWQQALDREIGADIVNLKRPTFVTDASFDLPAVQDESIDVAVAQSIYSHAGLEAIRQSLSAMARVLKPDGQVLFTAIVEGDPSHSLIEPGESAPDWVYPECVYYSSETILSTVEQTGLVGQQLSWFHPRQTWFRAVLDSKLLLTPELESELGTGRPLFDARF